MAGALPRLIVLQAYLPASGWLKYVNDDEVSCSTDGEGVFELLSKIEIEPAKNNNNHDFHIRFCQTNKYWARDADGWLVANSAVPEEDKSKPSCTIFNYIVAQFQHAQTGGNVCLNSSNNRVYVGREGDASTAYFTIWDLSRYVKLPKHIAFKGDNDKYLYAVWTEGYPYHQFSSNDANVDRCGYQITHFPNGHVRVKSDYYGKFWRRSPNWIWADSTDTGTENADTVFWPVKIDETTIALRNDGNDYFCKRLTTEGKTDCLNAGVSTIVNEAKLVVQELVLDRKVYNVRYQMEYARIYDEKPFIAGRTTAINNTDQEALTGVEIPYEESNSYTFNRSLSITAGLTITLEAGIPLIAKEGFEIGFEVNGTFEWSDTTTKTKGATATGSVPVPARSSAKISYVGTTGTCDIPFIYTQEDRRSTDGVVIKTEEFDGVFTGVNSYNFDFQFDEITAL